MKLFYQQHLISRLNKIYRAFYLPTESFRKRYADFFIPRETMSAEEPVWAVFTFTVSLSPETSNSAHELGLRIAYVRKTPPLLFRRNNGFDRNRSGRDTIEKFFIRT